jgi:aspartyl-tRNA(Asn)/glutamyl-tRNA(Gln) amidotransferase subunit C
MIQQDDVRHIAKLARLSLDDVEVETFTGQLGRILSFFDELAAIDTTDAAMTAHPLPLTDAFRADVARPSLPVERLLAAAPAPEGAYFRVPKILEG